MGAIIEGFLYRNKEKMSSYYQEFTHPFEVENPSFRLRDNDNEKEILFPKIAISSGCENSTITVFEDLREEFFPHGTSRSLKKCSEDNQFCFEFTVTNIHEETATRDNL